LVEDPKWELAILATVQGFYEKLLQDAVGGEVPVPAGLEVVSLQESGGNVRGTLSAMRRWLSLLDMAITPAMLRRAFTLETDPEIAEAILRYLTRKKDPSDANRDKTDLIATFLYRYPRVPGQWQTCGYGLDGLGPLPPFEIALIEILTDSETPALSDEQMQALQRFEQLRQEAEGFTDLNTLLNSGIIPRVRELKQSLDTAFYHPSGLAAIAPYNVAFGRKFDYLFHRAAAEIRSFAEALDEQGGSILGTVDGIDVTVEHVAALEESELLRIDYGTALVKFRRVSELRRTLEQRPPIRLTPRLVHSAPIKNSHAARASHTPVFDLRAMRSAVTPQQISTEESKLLRIEQSIRAFVLAADPKFRLVVPMRFFNLTLTPAEATAYGADYLEEKSIRAGVARVLVRIVAVIARMTTELEELRRAENSPSLWRLRADALVVLLEIGHTVRESGGRLMGLAAEDGTEDGRAIQASLQRLQECVELAERELVTDQAMKSAGAGVH